MYVLCYIMRFLKFRVTRTFSAITDELLVIEEVKHTVFILFNVLGSLCLSFSLKFISCVNN